MEVKWTKFAFNSLKSIFKYYKENVNELIANNIKDEILSVTKQLEHFHLSGKKEDLLKELMLDHRFIVKGNYKVIYRIEKDIVYITDVFDTRQNPNKILTRNK